MSLSRVYGQFCIETIHERHNGIESLVVCLSDYLRLLNKANSLRFNVLFSFMILRHLLFYSALNAAGLAANEATVLNLDPNLTQVSVI